MRKTTLEGESCEPPPLRPSTFQVPGARPGPNLFASKEQAVSELCLASLVPCVLACKGGGFVQALGRGGGPCAGVGCSGGGCNLPSARLPNQPATQRSNARLRPPALRPLLPLFASAKMGKRVLEKQTPEARTRPIERALHCTCGPSAQSLHCSRECALSRNEKHTRPTFPRPQAEAAAAEAEAAASTEPPQEDLAEATQPNASNSCVVRGAPALA
eukprot:11650080-Alexandrium_andersonii.AAC.1